MYNNHRMLLRMVIIRRACSCVVCDMYIAVDSVPGVHIEINGPGTVVLQMNYE